MSDLLSLFLVQSFNGVIIAMAIYLIASGLSLVFGVLGVLNFAHGSFYMLGAFLVFTFTRHLLKTVPGNFWLAVLIVPVLVALMGLVIEMGLLRFIYKADPLYQLLLTYGLVLMLTDAVKLLWGAQNQSVLRPPGFAGSVSVFGHLFPSYNVWILLPVSVLTMVGLYVFMNHTGFGRIVRAATQDREMVGALGINVRRLYTTVFVIGSWLGGLGGVIAAPMGAIYPGMDFDVFIPRIAANHASVLDIPVLFATFLATHDALAEYRFDVWTTDSGLPHNTVRDILQSRGHALVAETRIAPDDEQAGDLAEIGDDVFGNAVRKILLLWIPAHVVEREDCD